MVYSLGSVIARPLTKTTSAAFMSGLTMLPGGLVLTFGALALEPGAAAAARFDWTAPAWGGWLFLVLFGSLIAFTAYMRLIAVWGPARAGSLKARSRRSSPRCNACCCWKSSVGLRDGVGMALLLLAAFCSLRTSGPAPRPGPLG